MVLAAGLGTRLRPLTYYHPKPVLPILNRPLLHYCLEYLDHWGIFRYIINLHHLSEQVRECAHSYARLSKVHFSLEQNILGTGGALKRVADLITSATTLILINGDILFQPDLTKALAIHRDSKALATLVLRHDRRAEQFGLVGTDRTGRIVLIPPSRQHLDTMAESGMFSGVHLINPTLFHYFPDKSSFCIVRDVYHPLVLKGAPIMGVFAQEPWSDIGTIERYFATQFEVLQRQQQQSPTYDLPLTTDQLSSNLAFIHPSARIEHNVRIGHRVIIGPDCILEQNSQCEHALLLPGSRLARNTNISSCILHPHCLIPLI